MRVFVIWRAGGEACQWEEAYSIGAIPVIRRLPLVTAISNEAHIDTLMAEKIKKKIANLEIANEHPLCHFRPPGFEMANRCVPNLANSSINNISRWDVQRTVRLVE
jgi:hypothetical protein